MPVPTTKKELQKSANIFLGSGLVLSIGGRLLVMPSNDTALILLGIPVALAGIVLWVIGCMRYAMSKGQNQWLGLIGLFSCLGLIILAVLPDKWNENVPPPQGPSNYPRYPQG